MRITTGTAVITVAIVLLMMPGISGAGKTRPNYQRDDVACLDGQIDLAPMFQKEITGDERAKNSRAVKKSLRCKYDRQSYLRTFAATRRRPAGAIINRALIEIRTGIYLRKGEDKRIIIAAEVIADGEPIATGYVVHEGGDEGEKNDMPLWRVNIDIKDIPQGATVTYRYEIELQDRLITVDTDW